MNLSHIKKFVKAHKRLLQLARFVLRRKRYEAAFTFDDVGLLVNEWCRTLPNVFDCIIGIPRSGLIVANMIALNFGAPLSTPDDFMRGVVWQSQRLEIPCFKRVLIVDDCVDKGRELLYAARRLRHSFPNVAFEVGSLIKNGGCNLDYCFVVDSPYTPQGDSFKYNDGVARDVRVVYDDFL